MILSDFSIRVELRLFTCDMNDPVAKSHQVPVTTNVAPHHINVPTAQIRSHHLSWQKFDAMLHRKFGSEVNWEDFGIGYVQSYLSTPAPPRYRTIDDELTFQTAIAVLLRGATSINQPLVICLWSPKPVLSVVLRYDLAPTTQIVSQPKVLVTGGNKNHKPNLSTPTAPSDIKAKEKPSIVPTTQTISLIPKANGSNASNMGSSKTSTPPGTKIQSHVKNNSISAPIPNPRSKYPPIDLESPPRGGSPFASRGDSTKETGDKGTEFDPEDETEEFLARQLEYPVRTRDEDEIAYQDRLEIYHEMLNAKSEHQLVKGFNVKELQHLSEETWKEECRILRHDYTKQTGWCVSIKGFALKLSPAQAHSLIWAMRTVRGLPGSAFVSLDMGLGKTAFTLAFILVNHIFVLMWKRIKENPDGHCNENSAESECCGLNGEMVKEFGYDCPCWKKSPTHWIIPIKGTNVVMVLPALLMTWEKEFDRGFPAKSNIFHVKMWKAHGTYDTPSNETLALLKGHWTDGTLTAEKKVGYPRIRPIDDMSSLIVLSTPKSIGSRFLDLSTLLTKQDDITYMTEQRTLRSGRVELPKKALAKASQVFPGVFGIIAFDEFHKHYLKSSDGMKQLTRMRDLATSTGNVPPRLIFLSGTPIESGPLDIAAAVNLMSLNRWGSNEVLKHWAKDELTELGKAWKREVNTGKLTLEKSANYTKELRPLLMHIMIRFTKKSYFLAGGPVAIVPKNVRYVPECELDNDWAEKIEAHKAQQDNKLRRAKIKHFKNFNADPRNKNKPYPGFRGNLALMYYRDRLYASFPYLINIVHSVGDKIGEHLDLTKTEWEEKVGTEWVPNSDSDPYFRHRKEIFKSSVKLRYIKELITRHQPDIENGAQLCFSSFFLVGAYLIYLYVIHECKIPAEQVVYIPSGMSTDKVNELLADFCTNEISKKQPRILIGMSSVFGTGLNFRKIKVMCLLEPDWKRQDTLQFHSRHWRPGSIHGEVHSYMLTTKGNGIEGTILSRTNMQAQIQGAVDEDMAPK